MDAPVASWVLLGLGLSGAALALTAVVAGRRLGWGNMAWFLASWLAGELAPLHFALSAAVLGIAAWAGALEAWPGRIGAALVALSWLGLALAQWRTRTATTVLDRALAGGLGEGYRTQVPAARRTTFDDAPVRASVVGAFRLRHGPVEWTRDVRYGDAHPRQLLDVYRPGEGATPGPQPPGRGAPVLLQVHGGGWTLGDKREQALPLMYHLAARGWVCVAPNYSLAPGRRFPAPLLDLKLALAWIRRHVAGYGGDPAFVAVTGGSAGAHLGTLLALTAGRPELQPGFEALDARVQACVPLYGVYDFLDRCDVRGDRGAMTAWLARRIMPCAPSADPGVWDLASPLALVRADAPPFFVLHGAYDSIAKVEEARLFVERLRAASRSPVVYAELPYAQHAWDVFHSVRADATVQAVARFLEWAYARHAASDRAAAA